MGLVDLLLIMKEFWYKRVIAYEEQILHAKEQLQNVHAEHKGKLLEVIEEIEAELKFSRYNYESCEEEPHATEGEKAARGCRKGSTNRSVSNENKLGKLPN